MCVLILTACSSARRGGGGLGSQTGCPPNPPSSPPNAMGGQPAHPATSGGFPPPKAHPYIHPEEPTIILLQPGWRPPPPPVGSMDPSPRPGGATTIGLDATHPPAICQNSRGGSWGGGRGGVLAARPGGGGCTRPSLFCDTGGGREILEQAGTFQGRHCFCPTPTLGGGGVQSRRQAPTHRLVHSTYPISNHTQCNGIDNSL